MPSVKEAIEALEVRLLEAIHQLNHDSEFGEETGWSFQTLSLETGMTRDMVRVLCRQLTDKRQMHYHRVLFTVDGEPCGSGYAITAEGVRRIGA